MRRFDTYEREGPYHWKRFEENGSYRTNVIKIKGWVQKGTTIDVGAGDGLITYMLDAIGIDNNDYAIELARERGVDVRKGDVYNIPFNRASFDSALMVNVIEHLERPGDALSEVNRVLKEAGMLYIVASNTKGRTEYQYKKYSFVELKHLAWNVGFRQAGVAEFLDEKLYISFKKAYEAI